MHDFASLSCPAVDEHGLTHYHSPSLVTLQYSVALCNIMSAYVRGTKNSGALGPLLWVAGLS